MPAYCIHHREGTVFIGAQIKVNKQSIVFYCHVNALNRKK